VPEPEPGCWLHPDVEVRASDIAGRGLFAGRDLPAHTVVSRLGGRLVDTATLHTLTEAGEVDSVVVDHDSHLLLAPGDHRFVNHSCEPDLGWVDAYALATMSDVAAGAELVSDYAMSIAAPDWLLRCHCPSRRCRQMVEGTDWRIPVLQERYDGWWTPYVQRLVDRSRTGLVDRE
jgi:hypothetical protein